MYKYRLDAEAKVSTGYRILILKMQIKPKSDSLKVL